MSENNQATEIKIYLAAPTPSSAEQRGLFLAIQEAMVGLGCRIAYDWLHDQQKYSAAQLRQKHISAIESADLVVAEVTYPSVGLGQQIEHALGKKIPVLALHASAVPDTSRFLVGSQGDLLSYVHYNQKSLAKVLRRGIRTRVKGRMVRFNFISTANLNAAMDERAGKMGLSRSELVRLIVRDWMEMSSNP